MRPFKFRDEWVPIPGEALPDRRRRLDAREIERKLEDADRQAARRRSAYFLRTKKIERPPCVCGEAKAEMHHVDYAAWFLIGFLCRRCHIREHMGRLGVPFKVHDLRELAHAAND